MPKRDRCQLPVAVYLVIKKDEEVLLLKRFQTGFADGYYSMVAGCIDGGESITAAMIREAKEEAGITLEPSDLSPPTVLHRSGQKDHWEALCFFFVAKKWSGEIINAEPHKCDDLSFFPLDNLPNNMIPYVKEGLFAALKGVSFVEYGW